MYKTIVVGTDGSATSAKAVETACDIAKAFGATVHLVSAYRPAPLLVAGTSPGLMESAAVEAGQALAEETVGLVEKQRAALAARGIEVEGHTGAGEASDVILDVAGRCSADLVVVGSKGMTGARQILGSVPNRVSHRARTSVLIVKTT
jgi:nucleotide-binding universal stress UspA family protein